ncbi:MAG: hypothetical protein R3236_05110, partial [Phycisphaeraceae bacterium]|nr:hypothetical protein [Phycisphaeraceae bacterium]
MTWPLAKLGSRFSLLFEPARRRVMHSALGRFLDAPLDLAVGIQRPDGQERVLPLTAHGTPLYGCEQFERAGSLTFRGHDPDLGLRFEFNIRSPFYPQDERHCLLPVFFMELRVDHQPRVRLRQQPKPPRKVRVFIRFGRDETDLSVDRAQVSI